jgi:Glycosyl hydrolase family 79 C-terminal beta domain
VWAKPVLYGLILVAQTLGPDAQLVQVRTSASRSLHLKAWAVRLRSGALHVLLINKGSRPAAVALRLPGSRAATIERLLAPSAAARSGVTLGGQRLSATGAWVGTRLAERIVPAASGYQLTIPGLSVALIDTPGHE